MNSSVCLCLVMVASVGASASAATAPVPVRFSLDNLPPRSVMERMPDRPIPEWLRTNVRIGHLPGGTGRMLDEYAKAGYNVITINCTTTFIKVGPAADLYKPEEVKQADEYLRTFVDKVHKAGAKAVMYIGPVQTPVLCAEFAKAHPDWLRIRADGKPDPTPNFASIRTAYADWICRQLEYVTKTYNADGYWFDGFAPVHLHTYDEKTRQAFREFSGGKEIPLPAHDIPDQPMYFDVARDPVAREYMAWHEKFFVDFAERMRDAVRRGNPDAAIFVNHSGNRTWYLPDYYMGEYPGNYSSAVDVSSIELYWDVPGDPLYQQFCYAFMQGVTRERGAAVWIQPSAHGISGVSSPVEIQLRGLEGLGWGVYPEFVESTGREEYLKLHVENMKARDKWLAKSRAVPYIGIVASEQTRTLYAQGALPVYFSHTLGAFRALQEKHLPVRVLTEYDLEDGDLQAVQVLVMPNVAVLSDRAAEVVRRFVQAGGGLIASYETSMYTPTYEKRADFLLADLFRAKYVDAHAVNMRTENIYLTVDADHPIVDDPAISAKMTTAWTNPEGSPQAKGQLALVASATEVRPLDGASVISTYNLNDGQQRDPRLPAIVTSQYGKGRVVYLAASIDKGMFFYPDSYMRQMLANAVKWVSRDTPPPFEAKAPLMVTTTYREQPDAKRYVVHLTNNASSWGQHSIYQKLAALPEELSKQWGFPNQSELRGTWPVREEIIPLHNIKVICRKPGVTKATLQPENLTLQLERVQDGVHVTVPELGMHSMVVFE